jgi:DNA-binding LacI/PurR family transcriptional regulator
MNYGEAVRRPPAEAGSGRGHATQADVARRAGVSRALVGIVFRNQPGASQENRDHIRAVAAEIGYVPDRRAQLLSRKRTGIIGVSYSLTHDFHSTTVEHLYQSAERVGLSLVLSGYGPTRSEESALATLLAYRCEGVVLIGSSCPTDYLQKVAEQVPTVVIFRPVNRRGVGVVRTDDLSGSRTATEHLLGLGHRRLIHVNGSRSPGAHDRRKGFRQTVERHGLDFEELRGGSTDEDGLRAGQELVSRIGRVGSPGSPTAAVVFNDQSAVGVIAAVRACGIRVPQDLSVVGFDDSRLAGVPGVALTTMRQDTAALAHHAMEQLAARTHDHTRPAAEVVIPADLVLRGTTALPQLAEAS